jgi:cysteine synthase B
VNRLPVSLEPRDLLSAIGHTPLIELTNLLATGERERGVRLFAKLEGSNPTGSVKDRVALSMVRAALDDGRLSRGQTMLEPTSGNTGISLGMVAKALDLRLKVVLPENATPERLQLLRMFDVEIVSSEAALGSNGAVRLAQELAASDPSLYMPMQYENPANPNAHYEGTAVELLEQLDGEVDAFVAGLGTGGTLTGTGRRLREHNPSVQIVAAEPLPGDPVMGLRSLEDGYTPPVLDLEQLDRRILVSNRDAVLALRALADVGVFAGVSSGAVAHVARRIARDLDDNSTIAVLFADNGWKYLSAGLWDRDIDDLTRDMEHGHWW